jgi:hypothetical protein
MKLIRFIIVVLGSFLYFPVSCTLGVVGGTLAIAWLDSRDVQKGDPVHSPFSVVAIPQNSQNKSDFLVLPLQKVEQIKADNAPLSFLMPLSNSTKEADDSHYSYKVVEDRGKEQTIEVIQAYKDGDNTIWSKYRATEKGVYPLSSRMFCVGFMFQAIPIGIIFSLCLYACGKILKRRINFQKNNDS